jgi:aspartyl-tRNA(Asn)/glutamyl-tRNA(Gln) amidotransferase subunit B
MRSAKEAVAYLKKIHTLVRYLEICDGNMQEGSFRCDANVSVRKVGAEKFGTRAEIKNINSFRFVEKAINYEVRAPDRRHRRGRQGVQETRLYDPDKGETRSMRSKEEANDYRYFPDPDLLPVEIDAAYIAGVKGDAAGAAGTEGRSVRRAVRAVGIRRRRAHLVEGAGVVLLRKSPNYWRGQGAFERAGEACRQLGGRFARGRAQRTQPRDRREPHRRRRARGPAGLASPTTPSRQDRQGVFERCGPKARGRRRSSKSKGLKQITGHGRHRKGHRRRSMAKNPGPLADYRSARTSSFGFFVGQVMKSTGGKANPRSSTSC